MKRFSGSWYSAEKVLSSSQAIWGEEVKLPSAQLGARDKEGGRELTLARSSSMRGSAATASE